MRYYRRIGNLEWREIDQKAYDKREKEAIKVSEYGGARILYAQVADRPVIVKVTTEWLSVIDARSDRILYETSNTPAAPARVRNWIEQHRCEIVSTDS